MLSAFTVDESTLPAQQDAAVGMFGGANWAPNLDNPQNKKFVASYEAAYNSVPGTYAMQAYDTAMLIDSAVKAVKGDLSNKDAVAAALKKGRLHLAARQLQVQHQRLPDPELLSDASSQSAPTANSRPRSCKKCSRITATATPRTARRASNTNRAKETQR